MDKTRILTAMSYGLTEEKIVKSLGVRYEEFRLFCAAKDIHLDTSYISSGMIEEMQATDYSNRKAATRYCLSLPVAIQIMAGNYQPSMNRKLDVTKSELEELVEMGKSYTDMAALLSTSVYHVKKELARYDVKASPGRTTPEEYEAIVELISEDKMSYVDIAEKYGLSASMITYIKRQFVDMPRRKKPVRAKPGDIVRLVDFGCSQEEVAKLLGITQPTVSRLYKLHKDTK